MPDDGDDVPAGPSGEADAATIGLWEATAAAATHDHDAAPDLTADVEVSAQTHGRDDQPTGETELDLGRAALEAGDADEAAVRLGLVLRVAPALAPAVLDLVEGRTERGMALVRGDAYRLVGREIEARRAFAEAASGGSWPPPAPDHEPDTLRDEPADPAGSPAESGTELHAEEHWAPAGDVRRPSARPIHDPPSQGDPA